MLKENCSSFILVGISQLIENVCVASVKVHFITLLLKTLGRGGNFNSITAWLDGHNRGSIDYSSRANRRGVSALNFLIVINWLTSTLPRTHSPEHAIPIILSLCHGIFTDQFIFAPVLDY